MALLAEYVEEEEKKEKEGKPMNHNAAVPKDPAPLAKVITTQKPMKYLGTLLSTQQEEVFSAHGIKKRMTTVRRSVRR